MQCTESCVLRGMHEENKWVMDHYGEERGMLINTGDFVIMQKSF